MKLNIYIIKLLIIFILLTSCQKHKDESQQPLPENNITQYNEVLKNCKQDQIDYDINLRRYICHDCKNETDKINDENLSNMKWDVVTNSCIAICKGLFVWSKDQNKCVKGFTIPAKFNSILHTIITNTKKNKICISSDEPDLTSSKKEEISNLILKSFDNWMNPIKEKFTTFSYPISLYFPISDSYEACDQSDTLFTVYLGDFITREYATPNSKFPAIILNPNSTEDTITHELGHLLGFVDLYLEKPKKNEPDCRSSVGKSIMCNHYNGLSDVDKISIKKLYCLFKFENGCEEYLPQNLNEVLYSNLAYNNDNRLLKCVNKKKELMLHTMISTEYNDQKNENIEPKISTKSLVKYNKKYKQFKKNNFDIDDYFSIIPSESPLIYQLINSKNSSSKFDLNDGILDFNSGKISFKISDSDIKNDDSSESSKNEYNYNIYKLYKIKHTRDPFSPLIKKIKHEGCMVNDKFQNLFQNIKLPQKLHFGKFDK